MAGISIFQPISVDIDGQKSKWATFLGICSVLLMMQKIMTISIAFSLLLLDQ